MPIGALGAKLNALFNTKLASLETKESRLVNALRSTKERFCDACDIFHALDAEPDTEDIWNPNINTIKSQKRVYAMTLRKVVEGMQLEADAAPNIYEKYASILKNARSTNTEMLKTNARYRNVIHCYSNHLRNFKKCAAELEGLTGAMERELANRSKELGEYNEIKGHIAVLSAHETNLQMFEDRNNLLKYERPVGMKEHEIEIELKVKKAEQESIGAQALALYMRMRELVTPLERASKKFDHVSAGKKSLYRYMSDPVAAIADRTEYAEFAEMVKRLRESIGTGKIDVKNKEAAETSANYLLDSDMYDMIEAYRAMKSAKSALDKEAARLETELKYMMSSKASAERAAQDAGRLQENMKETEHSIEATKATVERLVASYYGKSLSIKM